MNITVIGSGYVGLVTGTCFAEVGNCVTCVDVDQKKIAALQRGIMPIYEPGLKELVQDNIKKGRLHFVTSIDKQFYDADIYFIAVGTPSDVDGCANLQDVLTAAKQIGDLIDHYVIVVDKSTVPVYTAEKVYQLIEKQLAKRHKTIEFDVVSNPEFLKEGAAIEDFMRPDRVIIGANSNRAKTLMEKLYKPFTCHPKQLIHMGIRDAEMTKYVSNAMLATRISFMNEIAILCEKMGVDVDNVRIGIGSDHRIGDSFLYAGCGYGGSCFPKDIRALIHMAKSYQITPSILQAVEKRNQQQKHLLFEKLQHHFAGQLKGIKVALWGLSFKPDTDDMREAPSVVFLHQAIAAGVVVCAYDPVAMATARQSLPPDWFNYGQLILAPQQMSALQKADALILVTEWKPFRFPNFATIKKRMKGNLIIDGRNQYDPKQVRAAGLNYLGIGK